MSYTEYRELFDKAQRNGRYHMFIYDVIDSKETLTEKDRSDILKLIFMVYHRLEIIEQEEHRSILHHGNKILQGKLKKEIKDGLEYNRYDYFSINNLETRRGDLIEPFSILGDLYGFTIERDSMSAEQIDVIFEEIKSKLRIEQKFHKANGFYETDKYEEGGKLYYRGYCIQQLEVISKEKEETENEIEK